MLLLEQAFSCCFRRRSFKTVVTCTFVRKSSDAKKIIDWFNLSIREITLSIEQIKFARKVVQFFQDYRLLTNNNTNSTIEISMGTRHKSSRCIVQNSHNWYTNILQLLTEHNVVHVRKAILRKFQLGKFEMT